MGNLAIIILQKSPLFLYSVFWYFLIGMGIVTTLLIAGFYCGWICPFGAIQELLHRIVPLNFNPSRQIDRKARYIRYIILGIIVIAVFMAGTISIANYEPFGTLFAFRGTIIMWIFLIFVLIVSAIHFRFFCKYLCAVGAFLGILSKFSLFKIKTTERCVSDKLCLKCCQMHAINIREQDNTIVVNPSWCISCNECLSICRKNALRLKIEDLLHKDMNKNNPMFPLPP
jgi:polyferredoxin